MRNNSKPLELISSGHYVNLYTLNKACSFSNYRPRVAYYDSTGLEVNLLVHLQSFASEIFSIVFNQLQSSTPLFVCDFTSSPCQYKDNSERDSIHCVCMSKRIQTNSYRQQKEYLLSEQFSFQLSVAKPKPTYLL